MPDVSWLFAKRPPLLYMRGYVVQVGNIAPKFVETIDDIKKYLKYVAKEWVSRQDPKSGRVRIYEVEARLIADIPVPTPRDLEVLVCESQHFTRP